MKLSYLISKLIKKLHIPAVRNSNINKTAKVLSGSHIVNCEIGRYTYVGYFCTLINAKLGNFCSIADNCIVGGANHPIEWVSTSPVFHEGKNILGKNFSKHDFTPGKEITIGNDVWIGNNCIIKGGVRIANGAVIGMGSVLTKDVGEYEIWAGNPAKLIRKRFSDETISQLMESNWWNWNDDMLYHAAPNFNNVNDFIEKYPLRGVDS